MKSVAKRTAANGRPPARNVTIRLAAPDIEAARRLAARKGLPYQTYVKMLLHEALEREERALKRWA